MKGLAPAVKCEPQQPMPLAACPLSKYGRASIRFVDLASRAESRYGSNRWSRVSQKKRMGSNVTDTSLPSLSHVCRESSPP